MSENIVAKGRMDGMKMWPIMMGLPFPEHLLGMVGSLVLFGLAVWALHELVRADQISPAKKSDLAVLAIFVPVAGPIISVLTLRSAAKGGGFSWQE